MKLGLIGRGFVGNAIYENFKEHYPITVYDKNEELSTCGSVRDVCHNSDVIFVALPTPMKTSGQCDLSIIFNVLAQISYWYNDNIVIIKSTIPPGTCENLKRINPKLKIVFSPEFLTERTAKLDFLTQARIILGGAKRLTKRVSKLFEENPWFRYIIKCLCILAGLTILLYIVIQTVYIVYTCLDYFGCIKLFVFVKNIIIKQPNTEDKMKGKLEVYPFLKIN